MSSIQHSIVGLLGIKPILKMNNYVSKMEVARTKSKAFERVLRIAVEFAPIAERSARYIKHPRQQASYFRNS